MEITWEQKAGMCQLFNQNKDQEALEFVLANHQYFDKQAWDMFITGATITAESIERDFSTWSKLMPIIDENFDTAAVPMDSVVYSGKRYGFTVLMRVEFLRMVYADLKKKKRR